MADLIAINSSWAFEDVLVAARQAYTGGGVQSTGRRLEILRAWGSVVGRERAVAGLDRFRRRFRTKKAAADAAGFSDRTFRELEAYYQGLHDSERAGLTLTFDTRLHRFDATAFDALIAEVLGADTDVTIEERSNIDADGPAFMRVNGSRPEDLVAVAEAFYDRVWRSAADADDRALQRTMSALEVLFGPRLDRMRDDLSAVKANTAFLGDEDVREAITDKATEHVEAKRKKEFSTRTQRLITAVASEVKKRTLDVLVGEGVADAAIAIASDLGSDVQKVIEDARATRFARKLLATDEEDGRT